VWCLRFGVRSGFIRVCLALSFDPFLCLLILFLAFALSVIPSEARDLVFVAKATREIVA
jgi:hypothetical protein